MANPSCDDHVLFGYGWCFTYPTGNLSYGGNTFIDTVLRGRYAPLDLSSS